MNKLREPGGLSAVKYQGNAHVPLVAMDNIDAFNKAAVEYGLPDSFAFPSNDLYEAHKGTFYKVIRCLDQLGVEVRTTHSCVFAASQRQFWKRFFTSFLVLPFIFSCLPLFFFNSFLLSSYFSEVHVFGDSRGKNDFFKHALHLICRKSAALYNYMRPDSFWDFGAL